MGPWIVKVGGRWYKLPNENEYKRAREWLDQNPTATAAEFLAEFPSAKPATPAPDAPEPSTGNDYEP